MNTFQSIAAGLAIAAAACATIPIVGPIIAAVLLLIAAVIILIGQVIDKALEDAAARKEKEAAQKDLEAEEKKRSSDAFALTPICLTAAAVLFVSAVIVVRCRQTKESNA